MKTILSVICVLTLVGCARFQTSQSDSSYENGVLVRQVSTKASAYTLIESKSQLSQFKASQTDKTQSASVGSLSQDSNATNSVAAISDAAVFLGTLIKSAK